MSVSYTHLDVYKRQGIFLPLFPAERKESFIFLLIETTIFLLSFLKISAVTYTYDNASVRGKRNPIWWQTTVASAGNLTSAVYRIFGKPFSEEGKGAGQGV